MVKLTIDVYTEDLNEKGMAALIELISGSKNQSIYTPEATETPVEEKVRETVKASEEAPTEEIGPRVYGEPGEGRKRRTKDEMAEDEEIEKLASETNLAITTDVPASELLAEMKQAKAEDEPSDGKSDDNFELEDETPEEMSAEEFRAMAIGYNKKYGKEVNKTLGKYGAGLSKIPAGKYAEVKADLQETFGDA